MENLDFEIEIDLASGRDYPVSVVRSPAGEGRGTLHFPYDELALDNHLTKLQLALLNSGRGQRRVVPAEERTVREFGTALFDALFAGEVRTLLDVSRHEARSKGTGLRVKLRCRAPELAALPWEFLFDTEVDEYLCLSRQTPLVRYLEVSTPCEPLRVALPLRILGVVASPKDLDSLDVDREKQRVEQAVAHLVESGKVTLQWLAKPTWRELQQELNRNRWHVIHFVGHGGFDQRRDEGVLAFEDDDGNAHLLGAADVGLLLGDHDDLRLAVLNACEGARSSTRDVFSSTAAVLVRKGTPGVVAMQYEITDLAAIELARSFYDCVAAGQPVDSAMSEARKAVRLSLPGTLEWGTPVLFMRAPDGVLFDVTDSAAPSVRPELPTATAATAASRREPRQRRIKVPGSRRVRVAALVAAVAIVAAAVAFAAWPEKSVASTGPAHLETPHGIALGSDGTLYVGDTGHHLVKAISPDRKRVTIVAGSGSPDATPKSGAARSTGIGDPNSLAVAPDGTIYVGTLQTNFLWKVSNDRISTLKPESGEGLSANGMAVGPEGNVLVASDARIYAVSTGGVFPVAGTGTQGLSGDGPIATEARVNNPLGIAIGPDRASFFFADSNNTLVRRVGPGRAITTVAGLGRDQAPQDGDKAAYAALGYPTDVAFDGAGNLHILNNDHAVFRVVGDRIYTVVPPTEKGFGGDRGPVAQARFGTTYDFAVSPDGDIYILDTDNNRVRKIHDGVVTTVG